jgi:molecular chaperone GrpE
MEDIVYYRHDPFGRRVVREATVPRKLAEEIAKERDLYRRELERVQRENQALRQRVASDKTQLSSQNAAANASARESKIADLELLNQKLQRELEARISESREQAKTIEVLERELEAIEDALEPPEEQEAAPEDNAPEEDEPRAPELHDAASEIERERVRAVKRAQELLEDLERLQRKQDEESDARARAAKREAVSAYLELRDNLSRAIVQARDHGSSWADGMEALRDQFDAINKRLGVERFGEVGDTFDPKVHEAIGAMHVDDLPQDSIAHVEREGFRFSEDGALLRSAQVVVAR